MKKLLFILALLIPLVALAQPGPPQFDPSDLAQETTLQSIDGNLIKCDTDNVAGAVTCNAGTNLNTSALLTEATFSATDFATETTLAAAEVHLGAMELLLTTIESNQLADGHNVTVDNATLAVTQSGNWDVRLQDGAGTALTSTLVGGDQALDVNVVQTVGGGGGGTEYTEDDAAAANPVGGVQMLVANSTPALEVADGDNVTRRATRYGAAYTQILDSSGSFVDTFGGGTQYTEGDVDASITGTAMLAEAPSDTLEPLQLDASNFLKITIENDSAGLATETGNLADIETLLTTIEGNQLADNHQVTVSNATIAVTQSGAPWDVDITANSIGLATEATLGNMLTEATFNLEDFATETTLGTLLTEATFNLEDFATETTLGTLLTESTFSAVDFATETTLGLAEAHLGNIDGDISAGAISADSIATATLALHSRGYLFGFNGSSWDRLRSSIANGLEVDITNSTLAVTQSGSPWQVQSNSQNIATQTTLAAAEVHLGNIETNLGTDIGSDVKASEAHLGNIDTDTGVMALWDNGSNAANVEITAAPTGASAIEVQGTNTDGAAWTSAKGIPVCFKNSAGTDCLIPTGITTLGGGAYAVLGTLPLDINEHLQDFTSTGEVYGLVASTTGAKGGANYIDLDANQHMIVVGDIAHGAANSGDPVLIGAVASDYEPDSGTTGSMTEQGPSEVDASDRVQISTNLRGQIVEGVNKGYGLLDEIDKQYTDTNEDQSNDYEVWNYRECRYSYCLEESNGNPTRFTFKVYGSNDTVDYQYIDGFLASWAHEDVEVATEKCYSLKFRVHHRYVSVSGTCTGCDAVGNDFTLDDSDLSCSN